MKAFTYDSKRSLIQHRLKLILVIVFISGSCLTASAQFGVALGAKGGVALTTFKGTNVDNIDDRTSWLGGAFLNVQITPVFNIQPEILIGQRGADYTSGATRNKLVINYFEVPVLAKFRLPVGDSFFPHVFAGPNFSFRTNMDYTSTETNSGVVLSTNETDIRKNDIGAVVGAGFDIQSKSSGIFFTIDGRYGFGFNDLDISDNDIEIKHRGWSFAAGIGFQIGGR